MTLSITEIGGTTGDIEGLPFLEAIRQFILEVGSQNVVNVHVTLVSLHQSGGGVENETDDSKVSPNCARSVCNRRS